ncbi:MAG: hypothetical protein KKE39_03000 [Bacteroidetes bacterium]|nr:hypothetical protein [Bacteroidota bacterium]MBU1373476.1 hypothetical protein [Bacteroidota bacterium]MBU1485234.1 hypothetical protein [Bacteroidota bacterium]MBU1760762.1 hypothetical protein [Bacteroidota bacterium]MBU2045592.1 hypothetical protein [Bacteroidota bacterium]
MQKQHFFLITLISFLGFTSCSSEHKADKIVNQSIAFYGMDKLDNKTMNFDFRQYHYQIQLKKGDYFYERTFTDDSLGKVKDQLSNHGFVREVNGLVVPQTEKDSLKYSQSVNSVAYFVLLPLKLNDPAVEKDYLKSVMVNGKSYDEIKVKFKKSQGGDHFDDTFYFWFDQVDHSMDFFAYSEGGIRFRSVRTINKDGEIKIQDYDNLTSKPGETLPLEDYGKLFEEDRLIKLSEVAINNLKVK